jgi:hypothetical protein
MCHFRHTDAIKTRRSAELKATISRPSDIFLLFKKPSLSIEHICRDWLCCDALSEAYSLIARRTMAVVAEVEKESGIATRVGRNENVDLSFLPQSLTSQCQSLIESYHELHGYVCLPNVLWKARLGQFIETNREFRQLLKKASTTRSAKKSNEGFVLIATKILSLEILASSFAGWSAIYPEAGLMACAILKRKAPSPHMPLMEFYLYPPKYLSSAAIATLAPPLGRPPSDAELYQTSKPELSDEKQALGFANATQQTLDRGLPRIAAASPH